MRKIKEWTKKHKGETAAITTVLAGVVGIIIYGLLPPEEQSHKEEWIPPVKKNWYMPSND